MIAGADPRGRAGPARPAGWVLPHDLLVLARPDALEAESPLPRWAQARLRLAPLAVVRRAAPRGTALPVGVRGVERHERFAAWLAPEAVTARVTPEALARAARWRARPPRLPALAALDAAGEILAETGLGWGPVGAVGFELASGVPSVSPTSDLDVLVRAPARVSAASARALLAALAGLPARVDVQLETPAGGVALAELAAGPRTVVARTAAGPRRVADPWQPGAGAELP
jgi:phosphoribosyl-dephospho-CoA transferase